MTTRLTFRALGGDLGVALGDGVDADAVVAACRLLLPHWPFVVAPGDAAAADKAPDIAIVATAASYAVRAESWPGGVAEAGDLNNLANALGGLLIDAMLARFDALVCLHAAAVAFAGRAILFVGPSGAGKSTLALRFAARGHRILGDDRVLVDTGRGEAFALGLTAKARLPLPPGDDLAAFAAARTAMSDGGVSYLHLRAGEQETFGTRLPIGAIVQTARDAALDAPVAYGRIRAGALAAGLVAEATAPGAADAVVAAMTRLARKADGRQLRYAEGERAVDAVLRETLLTTNAMLT